MIVFFIDLEFKFRVKYKMKLKLFQMDEMLDIMKFETTKDKLVESDCVEVCTKSKIYYFCKKCDKRYMFSL